MTSINPTPDGQEEGAGQRVAQQHEDMFTPWRDRSDMLARQSESRHSAAEGTAKARGKAPVCMDQVQLSPSSRDGKKWIELDGRVRIGGPTSTATFYRGDDGGHGLAAAGSPVY
jgi:hypothetical protein